MLAALVGSAAANGRPPATSTIHFRIGHESDIYAGMTFGLLVSHDNGATWHWMCEKAVGYGGMYDPYYAYTSQGSLYATTFDGLKKNDDGCVFNATQFGTSFVSANGIGSDNAVYVALADPAIPNATPPHPGDSRVYKTSDNGVTYPVSAMPGMVGDWWQSIVVTRANAAHVYLAGYRYNAPNPKVFLLFKSVNGGSTYTAMGTTGFTTSNNSQIEIVGVTTAAGVDTLYAKVSLENGTNTEGIYKSVDGGTTWTKILTKSEPIHFVARANGDLIAATQLSGTQKSVNGGATWTTVTGAPHINCLYENTAGELWACTLNYDIPGSMPITGDGYGIMKSTNETTWTGVLRFQDILAPVDCPAGTSQHDDCVPTWCGLAMQLGITSTAISCAAPVDGPPDAAGSGSGPPPKGCCDTGSGSGPAALVFGVVCALVIARPKRRKAR
ncbi:MAG: hypothetical protein JWO36_1049 [Myxococcales bacterium]|nr:hypothetical protein [Myxococcales bacterium]